MALIDHTAAAEEQHLARAIRDGIRKRIGEIAQEETAAAQRRIAERVSQELDKLALNLLSHYDVRSMGDRIVIEVRKP